MKIPKTPERLVLRSNFCIYVLGKVVVFVLKKSSLRAASVRRSVEAARRLEKSYTYVLLIDMSIWLQPFKSLKSGRKFLLPVLS